jgi:hypothetical protein
MAVAEIVPERQHETHFSAGGEKAFMMGDPIVN